MTFINNNDLNVTEYDREQVLTAFPVIADIQDKKLADAVVRTWVRCLKMSEYKNIFDIPAFDDTEDQGSAVKHTMVITLAAIGAYEAFEEEYALPLNKDFIIAGSLIHDVDKFLCYKLDSNKKRVLSEFGKIVPHGCFGTTAAIESGIPLEVSQIASSHSWHSSRVHSGTPEGVLVEYINKWVNRTRIQEMGVKLGAKTGYGG